MPTTAPIHRSALAKACQLRARLMAPARSSGVLIALELSTTPLMVGNHAPGTALSRPR